MKEKITYVADDGAEFNDEERCRNYESQMCQQNTTKINVRTWNKNGREFERNVKLNFNDVYFFKCKTPEDFDRLYYLLSTDVVYDEDEKTDLLFYVGYPRCAFMTVRSYESSLDSAYIKAKKLQNDI